ncbi:hypothetical protein LCI18_014530 [Fusarium solani-melongenae]|uniref:Uncharacterized protein n=1 Tax=Fusarium solani subsp. cucurbitae TaxID=2747967 RepID=A0ACD3ZQV1_FUSSC|nr:hypothetical protein LCI18_014530 [Fusarium solani-melongenae]
MQERGDQIAKMGQLFTGCFQVFLWLGDDIAFKKPGVHPPRLPLHELENLEELQLPSKTEPVNIRSLFERRYFSRVWIIQELILPPRLAIPIGDKIFWADPSTPTHFERLSSRDWLWEQTRAPWFQHATRGSVMQENIPEFMALTWRSQSSDTRDKVYGVIGLSSMKHGIQIRPDYGISLQHLIIGFFAHGIISGGAPELLLKAAESKVRKTIFDRSPWHQNATVDTDTGTMSLNLTRLLLIQNRPVRLRVFGGERWYQINYTWEVPCEDAIFAMSRSKLDEVVETGDGIFLLDTNVGAPIYMILRKMGNPREFRLIAACSHLAFLLRGGISMSRMFAVPVYVPSCKSLPLGDLQKNLHEELAFIRSFYDHDASNRVNSEDQGIRKRFLFPGRRGPVTFKEVLPLLFVLARDKHKQKIKSRGFQEFYVESIDPMFQELYLELIDPKFQPRVSNGFCELFLEAEDKEEIVNLLDCYAGGVKMKGWSRGTDKEGTGRVVLRRNMSVIGVELRTMVSKSFCWSLVNQVDRLVGRLEDGDADAGERIMAEPVEEDHFRGGTRFKRDRIFWRFGLDGSTFRVRIV